ncbi:DUF4253 domain-containing protein [Myxococcaceae bacterium GXIMD 01537]
MRPPIRILLLDVATDRLTVQFDRLPDDLGKLAKDVARFCPDTLEGFAAMGEQAERPEELPPDMRELLQGLEPDAKHFGLEVLQRWLRTHKSVQLWWD